MKLSNILKDECIGVGLKFKDKTSVLKEIAQLAKKCSVLQEVEEDKIFTALQERENLISTGLGKGIAIPHCRLDNVKDFVVGVVTVPEGVNFDAIDGKKIRLFIFIIAPSKDSNQHIRLLSTISQLLRQSGFFENILSQQTPESISEKFLFHTRSDAEEEKEFSNKNLFHVFVQDENLFRDILQVFTGVISSSVVVVDSQNENAYLSKIPLFAGFWNDKLIDFSKIIVAVVDKKMTNEIVRNIDQITGGLDNSNQVLVTIQNLFYTAGALQL
ncbi:MAG: PTS sugar transporter subunit IIA [Candidatus Aureabacteria bacterium]|nr:PTS sugar transporter subunit IIA [Candidatus Auribacterota bacterium]